MDGVKENQVKKEYLQKYGESKKAIRRIDTQLEEMDKYGLPSNTQISITTGDNKAAADLSNYITKKQKLIADMLDERIRWININEEIFNAINDLKDEDERQVLTLRYIAGMKWEKIAVEMHIEWAQVHRIHARALRNVKIFYK